MLHKHLLLLKLPCDGHNNDIAATVSIPLSQIRNAINTSDTFYLGYFYAIRIVFAPARKPYQIGLLFTHKNGDRGAISVTWSLISDRRSYYKVFPHDVTAAILVSLTNPVGVELFSYANAFFLSNKFA